MPLKKLKSVFKSITKPFKKVLRSPIGKVAGLAALYYGAPMLGGYGAGGAGWKKMLTAKAPWLYKAGEASVPGVQDFVTGKGTGSTGILANLGRKWGSMGTLGKAATIGGATMAAGAVGDEVIDETETKIDTSGHEGYLKARKNFVDEWADWYMQQGDDEETAYAKASEAMFNDGGIVGLAQGGRIGYAGGGTWGIDHARSVWDGLAEEDKTPYVDFVDFFLNGPWGSNPVRTGKDKLAQGGRIELRRGSRPGVMDKAPGQIKAEVEALQKDMNVPQTQGARAPDYVTMHRNRPPVITMQYTGDYAKTIPELKRTSKLLPGTDERVITPRRKPIRTKDNRVKQPFYGPLITGLNWVGDKIGHSKFGMWNNQMQRENYLDWAKTNNPEAYVETMSDLAKLGYVDYDTNNVTIDEFGSPHQKTTFASYGDELWEPQAKEILGEGYKNYLNRHNVVSPGGDGPQNPCDGPNPPAYCFSGVTAGASTPKETAGDYYGFSEWADWDPNNTSPLFGDATQYKAVLSKGGRIGLYAGGMGGMNNPMNPMMNRGLGAMGSPGMNPFNQQNLMAQGQMRGNPMMGGNPMMARGNPMMAQRPGIPAQGAGISGTQAAAKMAKKEDDGELLKLIRMLASMGIPMEQLRGRTKEELVEMAISLQKDQPTGRPEVVEESEEVEEEVMTAAGGGRVRAAEGYPNPEAEFMSETQLEENYPGLARGELGEVITEDEEKEIYIPQEKNPFERQGMEFDKPVGREGTFRADNPPVVYSLNEGGLMRTGYAMGSEQPVIPSKDGPQIDYREMGGYQPHGKKEKHDDVRALLAQGEFVVTSDAVKGIGGGDRDLGAKRMYDMMHKFEPIGRALS